MRRSAAFDPSHAYRRGLERRWGEGEPLVWVMLNPSTADHERDDPTIRRCIGFSKDWGFGALRVVNLFDLCATDPRELRDHPRPESRANREYVRRALYGAGWAVAGWGHQGALLERSLTYRLLLDDPTLGLRCLGTTRSGHPRHPLYVRRDTPHEEWPRR